MRITKEARCAKNAREYIGNRPRLVEGKIYTLIFRQQPERSEKHTAIKKRMRFLKAFPHHALFERCDRFIKRFNKKAECIMDDMASWNDYIKTIKEELGIELGIRENK